MFFQVNPQSQIIEMAVKQEVNLRFRAVNCCDPALKPIFPPKNVRSLTNPPEPTLYRAKSRSQRAKGDKSRFRVTLRGRLTVLHKNPNSSCRAQSVGNGHFEINIL